MGAWDGGEGIAERPLCAACAAYRPCARRPSGATQASHAPLTPKQRASAQSQPRLRQSRDVQYHGVVVAQHGVAGYGGAHAAGTGVDLAGQHPVQAPMAGMG